MKSRRRIKGLLEGSKLPETVVREFKLILTNKKEILPGWTPSFLRKLGDIRTVIDVGVLEGTPPLYEAFPEAELLLVEALPMYEKACRNIVKAHPGGGEVFMVAAGDADAAINIRYYPDLPAQSSILQTVVNKDIEPREVEVPLRKLDTLFAGRDFSGDALLKIDTEGFEYNVIKGATETLKRVKYCITETSIRRRHENSYRFADLVALMKDNGFDLYDVLTVTRTKAMTPRASIMDAVFINSVLENKA